jgi:hypothetical protein
MAGGIENIAILRPQRWTRMADVLCRGHGPVLWLAGAFSRCLPMRCTGPGNRASDSPTAAPRRRRRECMRPGRWAKAWTWINCLVANGACSPGDTNTFSRTWTSFQIVEWRSPDQLNWRYVGALLTTREHARRVGRIYLTARPFASSPRPVPDDLCRRQPPCPLAGGAGCGPPSAPTARTGNSKAS